VGLYTGTITPHIEDEIDMFFDQNVSYGVYHGDKIIAAQLNLVIEPSEDEETDISVSGVDWLNKAAELAEECEGDVVAHWRNSQYLHIQFVARKAARRWNAPFCWHFSCGAGAKDIRGKSEELTKVISTEIFKQVWSQGGVITTVQTIPGLEQNMRRRFPNNVTVLERVPYTSLNLSLGGRKVFHSLEHLECMCYTALHV